ncbi:MAG TPA: hypothetical protein DDW52_02875 [Planctomycetaceae bacterium]|nr:hypothetical protein [Planctomycetaceae bacterium]
MESVEKQVHICHQIDDYNRVLASRLVSNVSAVLSELDQALSIAPSNGALSRSFCPAARSFGRTSGYRRSELALTFQERSAISMRAKQRQLLRQR